MKIIHNKGKLFVLAGLLLALLLVGTGCFIKPDKTEEAATDPLILPSAVPV
ncbi:hypothetical protein FACS1894196_4130 [Clostridia bacterium]|nr:hypothetical protein FACS1894196_4130 [Clostridia bacterium]